MATPECKQNNAASRNANNQYSRPSPSAEKDFVGDDGIHDKRVMIGLTDCNQAVFILTR